MKGIQKKSGTFPVDNWIEKKNHFYVFVVLDKVNEMPKSHIIPSNKLNIFYEELKNYEKCSKKLIYENPKKTRKLVDLNRLKKLNKNYLERWDLIKIK